jgi:hypothetical protein
LHQERPAPIDLRSFGLKFQAIGIHPKEFAMPAPTKAFRFLNSGGTKYHFVIGGAAI